MVNSKNVAFKVNKQTPTKAPPPQAYGTVINCRKPGGKRALRGEKEVKSQRVRLTKVSGTEDPKRKRGADELEDREDSDSWSKKPAINGDDTAAVTSSSAASGHPFGFHKQQLHKPTKFRRGRTLSKGVDLDCWFTILSFSNPAQLLEMRSKIASCYRFLRDNPMLWKHSRNYYYGGSLPDPPSELTEFQYAHLRHGHGCMSCNTPSTRKTYWAFLRRWCKTCLQSKTIKEHDAMALFKGANGEDLTIYQKCLPSGIFDSWGNFVGVGPATTHSLKTVFLLSDVQKLVADYIRESRDNPASWHAEARTWASNLAKVVEERRDFARKMELWEDSTRQSKSFEYHEKKQARKLYFEDKAAQLTPLITIREMECCPSYRRAIAIPKDPNMTSWLQLKPKLEKEAADLKARGGLPPRAPIFSTSGSSTPSTDLY